MSSIIETRARLTRRLLIACAGFGLEVRRTHRGGPRRPRALARRLHAALRPGHIALLTGPSGSGKSTLLRELARLARARGDAVVVLTDEAGNVRRDRSVLDVIAARAGSVESGLALLARAGLADARLLPRRPAELSAGQRWRLGLALAMARAGRDRRAVVLLVDEFGSLLDRAAARALAATLARWARMADARAVCATAHTDLDEALGPSVRLELREDGAAAWHER